MWVPVVDPDDIGGVGGPVIRFTVDLPKEEAEFLERFAAYSNVRADERKERLRSRWSRKNMAEALLASQVKAIRSQLEPMMSDLGPLPPAPKPKDHEAESVLVRYVRRALGWAAKRIA